jgi:hypothetical protein
MEYSISMSQEIQLIKFSSFFHGKTFMEVQRLIQKHRQKPINPVEEVESIFPISNESSESFIMIGVHTQIPHKPNGYNIFINPLQYVIKHDDCAIVIASSKERASFLNEDHTNEVSKISRLINDFRDNIREEIDRAIIERDTCNGNLIKLHVSLWKDDIRKKLSGHILIFCLEPAKIYNLTREFRKKTKKSLCFIQSQPPDENWLRVKTAFRKVFYFEGVCYNLFNLSKPANHIKYIIIQVRYST